MEKPMTNPPCTYTWREMWGEKYPPECYVRMRLTESGEPDCDWCWFGGKGCLRGERK